MKNTVREWYYRIDSKLGLLGALAGVIAASFMHKQDDTPSEKAGKTAVYGGTGFLLGHWIEEKFLKKG
ncbi:MAG: hypothetical protein JXR41_11640 [Bacteroidales bacterium]|mgnify:CR=1 FL=1|nr:hypothetical protein [Bacteroidales bacterium]MBN2763735.1 hypothetical protein [Bacteroidales bacterium]